MLSNLYPARSRARNIQLIKGAIMAPSEAAFIAGQKAFAEDLHPSLFSELDFMEETIPPRMLPYARQAADRLFDENLPALLRMRADEFDISDDALRADVHENPNAYQHFISHAACSQALGAERVARIQSALSMPPSNAIVQAPEADDLKIALGSLRNRSSVLFALQVAVQNAALSCLDHLPSRMQAKAWLREACDGHLPEIQVSEDEPKLQTALASRLGELGAQAAHYRLSRVAEVVRTAQQFMETHNLDTMHGFDGDFSAWIGLCENCSMRFASVALSVIDPSIGFDANSEFIHLPIFNIVACPFCGHSARLNIPLMFYAPQRAQLVYCVPLMPGQDKETAIEIVQPMLRYFWKRYRERLSGEAATAFEQATELITYSVPEFLFTVQMGTTAPEWHAFLWVRLADGSWLASDPTKHAMISITSAEHAHIRAMIGDTDEDADEQEDNSPPPMPQDHASIETALAAFQAGQMDLARHQLEACLARDPGNQMARRNLAVVYLKLGMREDALRVLSINATRGEVNHG